MTMKKSKHIRILAAIMAALILLASLPLSVFATVGEGDATTQNMTPDVAKPEGADVNISDTTVNELTYEKWDGEVAAKLNGSGTQNDPYVINDGGELMYFANQVNGGNSYEGKYISLKNNIDMNMFQLKKSWTPVGVSANRPFRGFFDGECHEIINLNIIKSAKI